MKQTLYAQPVSDEVHNSSFLGKLENKPDMSLGKFRFIPVTSENVPNVNFECKSKTEKKTSRLDECGEVGAGGLDLGRAVSRHGLGRGVQRIPGICGDFNSLSAGENWKPCTVFYIITPLPIVYHRVAG